MSASHRGPPGPGAGDRGSVTLELVLVTPVLLLLLSLVVLAGRVTGARHDVAAAAADGARAASLEVTLAGAGAAADQAVADTLSAQGVGCGDGHTTSVATGGLGGSGGGFSSGNLVEVTVTCDVAVAGLGGPGLPGSVTESHTAVEIIDVHRSSG